MAGEATEARLEVAEVVAGRAMAFRVGAPKNGVVTLPSSLASVYADAASAPALRLAA